MHEREHDDAGGRPTGPDTDPDVHQDPDDPQPALSDEALETESLGEGGPSGA